METISKRFSLKDTRGDNERKPKRRKEWASTVKLWLLIVAIFGTVILLGIWQ